MDSILYPRLQQLCAKKGPYFINLGCPICTLHPCVSLYIPIKSSLSFLPVMIKCVVI